MLRSSGSPLDVEAMARQVDETLYRQRRDYVVHGVWSRATRPRERHVFPGGN